MNKLRAFLLRDFVPSTVADARLHLRPAPRSWTAGSCWSALPKGVLGEETARLLGSFIVAATWQAAAARAKSAEGARDRRLACYLDEATTSSTCRIPMEDMLAEARAYRLSLVLAHQNLAQMPARPARGHLRQRPQQGVLHLLPGGRAGPWNATPRRTLTEHDLSHLGGYQAAVRLLVDGVPGPGVHHAHPDLAARRPAEPTGSGNCPAARPRPAVPNWNRPRPGPATRAGSPPQPQSQSLLHGVEESS